jgi:hypothetical protein
VIGFKEIPLDRVVTVGQLLAELEQFDPDLPLVRNYDGSAPLINDGSQLLGTHATDERIVAVCGPFLSWATTWDEAVNTGVKGLVFDQ